jgi:transcriptional regulator with XRE-family HTH domain
VAVTPHDCPERVHVAVVTWSRTVNRCAPAPRMGICVACILAAVEPGTAAREALAAGDYGTAIRLWRQERGLTQGQLGALCSYSQSAVSRLEQRGAHGAYDVHMLRRIADVLDLPPDQFVHPVNRRTVLAGLGSSLAASVAQLEDAASAAGSDDRREPVLRLLAQANEAMGELAFDRLRYADAAGHFHTAHQIGVELGDPEIIATTLTQLGDVARRQHRYSTALRLFDTAEHHAATAGVFTQVLRCRTAARALAEIGDRAAFDRAIRQAEDLAARIAPEHHREGDHSPRGVRLERGQGLTLLGDPAAALAIYDQCAPPAFRSDRERGSFVIIHAQALAHAGDLDEGVRLAIEGLHLARSYQSPRHVSRVQRMYDRLTEAISPAEPPLVQLREALAA